MVLAFNRRLVAAIDANLDVTDTVAALDPDPLRYMWVDEGDGQIPAQLAKAAAVLDGAPHLSGQRRVTAEVRPESCTAAGRPSPSTRTRRCPRGWDGRGTAATGRWPKGAAGSPSW